MADCKTPNGKEAIEGRLASIAVDRFQLKEDFSLTFEAESVSEGASCTIYDEKKNVVHRYDEKDGKINVLVYAGWECVIMKALVKFEQT